MTEQVSTATLERKPERQVDSHLSQTNDNSHTNHLPDEDAHKTLYQRLPIFYANVAVLAAIWSLFSFFVHGRRFPWVHYTTDVWHGFNIPAGPGLIEVVLLVVFAFAAFRRKRVVVYVVVFYQVMGVLGALLIDVMMWSVSTPWERAMAVLALGTAAIVIPVTLRFRKAFPGRLVKGSGPGALAILVVGLGGTWLFGFLMGQFVPGIYTAETGLMRWVSSRVFGTYLVQLFMEPSHAHAARWLGALLSVMAAIVFTLALAYFLRGQRMPGRTPEDDLIARRMLAKYGAEDSLGYFATRNDRSLVVSTDGKAAVSYSVAAGVSMIGGDPLGDPQSWDNAITQWRELCGRYGWIPAAISTSEKGARALRNQGFSVRALGDEAIIHTNRFDINSHNMKQLAAAVRRVRREGVDITIRRLEEIPADEMTELRRVSEEYRVGEERGFSMSLDRILDEVDGRTLVVVGRQEDGTIQGVLTFAPWGQKGVSLAHMRRKPDSVNGIVEAMVVALIEHGQDGALDRISLNFAMFRKVFEEGLRVDAGLYERAIRKIMVFASKFWQLESLYESNARYEPEWYSRYFCYLGAAQLTPVILAAGELEGFMPQLSHRTWQSWKVTPEHLAAVREIEQQAVDLSIPREKLPEQMRVRRDKAARLEAAGMEAWPPSTASGEGELIASVVAVAKDLQPGTKSGKTVDTSGRILAKRNHGGVIFADLVREQDKVQLVLDRSVIDPEAWKLWHLTDIGDVIAVNGEVTRTARGENSIEVKNWQMLAKTLRPLPSRHTRMDPRIRSRERVAHLLNDPSALNILVQRSTALTAMRQTLGSQGYLEVETPMLHPVKGGANARPFVTHFNAYGTDVFMRIAPELYLKRLAVAGMDAIFEMGRSFRNEGVDATHNPEFTSLEAYRAGGDYHTMRLLTQQLIQDAAIAVHGRPICHRPKTTPGLEDRPVVAVVDGIEMVEFDLSGEWPAITIHDAVSKAVGEEITIDTEPEVMQRLCQKFDVELPPVLDHGQLLSALYDDLVEAKTTFPTFYMDFPKDASPLTRQHRVDDRLAEKWDLVGFGMELGTAYTELTDPIEQRKRFEEQSLAAAAGDPEAMSIDNTFLDDLELGLQPTGGVGLGVDRLVMLITGVSIRQCLTFPYVRPLNTPGGE